MPEIRDKLSALGSEQFAAMRVALRQDAVSLAGKVNELNEELAQQLRQVDCVAVQELFTQEGLKRWNTAMELYLEQSPQNEIDARQEVVVRMRAAGYEAQELKLSGLQVSSIPDLSSLPKLRRLFLNNCHNLIELNISNLGA